MSDAAFLASWFLVVAVTALYLKRLKEERRRAGWQLLFLDAYIAFFFAGTPILHYLSGTYVEPELMRVDPVIALTQLNVMNASGLLVAHFAGRHLATRGQIHVPVPDWAILQRSALFAFCLSCVAAGYLYTSGDAFLSLPGQRAPEQQATIGIYMLVESGPLCFFCVVACSFWRRGRSMAAWESWVLLAAICVLAVALSSLRGSRVAALTQVLICLIIVDRSLRRIRAGELAAMIAGLAVFIHVYSYYKYGGMETLLNYLDGRPVPEFVSRYLDPMRIALGDFGRSDIQAVLLDRYISGLLHPNYWGETYLYAFAQLLPRQIRPEWIESKVMVGAIAQYGIPELAGLTNVLGGSSRIYGHSGEALLNFGLPGVVAAFAVFGVVHRAASGFASRQLRVGESLILPYVILLPAYYLFFDLENIVFQSVVVWTVPVTVYFVAVATTKRRQSVGQERAIGDPLSAG